MQSVLPSKTNFRDWIYTLVALFVLTTILVINLPHITALIQSMRGWQDLWVKLKNLGGGSSDQGEVGEEAEENDDDDDDDGIELLEQHQEVPNMGEV
jgi:hypothetical protein